MQRLMNYEDKLFSIINKYKIVIDYIINIFDITGKTTGIVFEYIFFNLSTLFTYTQRALRYTTFPIHWIWLRKELKFQNDDKLTDLPMFEMGGHYIYGKPGAGKSTSVYHAMMDYAYFTGRTSYTTEYMELPRKDIYGREYYYHQTFDPSEFFEDGKQTTSFDTDKHNMVVYEEMLSKYHQRNNSSKSHNDEVLPLVASMGGQRHQGKGIDLFYFISQLPTNDISIMQMLRWYHEPQIKKTFDYKLWLDTGKIRFKIKGWKIVSHKITPSGRSDYKLIDKKVWFYKMKYYEDFKYYNKLNLARHYAELPKHKGVEMTV